MQITFNSYMANYETSVSQFYWGITHWIIPESLLIHFSSYCGWMFIFEAKLKTQICWCSHLTFVNALAILYINSFNAISLVTAQPHKSLSVHACKVSRCLNQLPSHIKTIWYILERLKIAGYFLDRFHVSYCSNKHTHTCAHRDTNWTIQFSLFFPYWKAPSWVTLLDAPLLNIYLYNFY